MIKNLFVMEFLAVEQFTIDWQMFTISEIISMEEIFCTSANYLFL